MLLFIFRAGFVLVAALAGFLLLAPRDMMGATPFNLGDTILHIGLMALVAGFGVLGFYRRRFVILVILIGIGTVTEFGQLYVPGREFHWSDMGANLIGIALGFGAGWLGARLLGRHLAPDILE